MVTFKQQVVQKAIDNYIEAQERGLEVAQKALAMHQKMHRAEVQEAEALGRPVEYIDTEERTVSDELRDGQREIEATRQRIEEARTARLNGPRASEDFLNDHKTDTWADQTALDEFGVTPPKDSGVGPIEDYEPGQPASDDGSELPITEPAEPSPMPSAGAGTPRTLNTGKKKPDWTLKPGEGQLTPAPPSEPSTPSPEPPSVAPRPGPPTEGPGGTEPAEGPGVLSRLGGWLMDTAAVKVMHAGWQLVKAKVKNVIGRVALVGGALLAVGGLVWALWPSGSPEPPPRPPESPGVQAPGPASPEPAPPNPFEPPQAPEGVPQNPFGRPETAPPNPFEPPQAPEGVPQNPFEPPTQRGGEPGSTGGSGGSDGHEGGSGGTSGGSGGTGDTGSSGGSGGSGGTTGDTGSSGGSGGSGGTSGGSGGHGK